MLSPRPASRPRVVIVDADRRVRRSLSELLAVSGQVEVVARAGDVRSALEAVEEHDPDMVLIDPRLPDLDAGTALIQSLGRARPNLRVVLTEWTDAEGHGDVPAASARVSKDASPEAFVAAILDACGC